MAPSASKFPAYVVREPGDGSSSGAGGNARGGVEQLVVDELPLGEVVIEVEFSSLNYKDALASRGHRGVVGKLPHVPGIDAAGRVVDSTSPDFAAGDAVLVTGYGLGSERWGGYSRLIRVPAEWPVQLPEGFSPRDAMIRGTAGFTAGQAVDALLRHGVQPGDGPVLVTGATGGVGVFAVAILARLGFEVVAMTGKDACADRLRELGAAEVVGRDALDTASGRPLLKGAWAGGVDTVGGAPLAALVRSTSYRGCVACCGLVAGADLPLTVHPFILRGVTLAGIDSAKCPRGPRLEVWRRLAGEWRVELHEAWVTTVSLDHLPDRIDEILAGNVAGRTLVVPESHTV